MFRFAQSTRHSSGSANIRVAVIGGGFGGIAAAVKLQKAGIPFTVFERSDGVGGVWRQNTYPGAEVDVPSHWYSLSFRQNDWSRTHSAQRELLDYIEATVDEFGIRPHFQFNTSVERVEWNETTHTYAVYLPGGACSEFEVVISAIGLFNIPKHPAWPGLESFRGPVIHPAEWDHDQDLTGKRVALVGAGSTGTQIARAIAPVVAHLFVIVRSPGWVISKGERIFDEKERAQMRNPLRYRLRRAHIFALEQWRLRGGKQMRRNTKANREGQAFCQQYIESVFKDRPDLAKAVRPDHPYFGKRPIKATGYYDALLRENVTFLPRAVTRVTETCIVDSAGEEHEVDAIITATGFRAAEFLRDINVIGRGGQSIHDVWKGEPDAFLGLTVPGFPNFYMLYGPNTNMGTIVFNLETQADYAIRDIKHMLRTGVSAMEVRRPVYVIYNRWLQHQLRKTVWVETETYYKSASGKLVVPFHTGMIVYWALCHLLRRISTFDRRRTSLPDRPSVPLKVEAEPAHAREREMA